jgi:hypothetical protein
MLKQILRRNQLKMDTQGSRAGTLSGFERALDRLPRVGPLFQVQENSNDAKTFTFADIRLLPGFRKSGPTLGWRTESRWDCKTLKMPKRVRGRYKQKARRFAARLDNLI